jgi:heme/copper-type cytochrome/quinol oxidase subunit 3
MIMPIAAAMGVIREVVTGNPLESLTSLVVAVAVCLLAVCAMRRRDGAELRIALAMGFGFTLILGAFFALGLLYLYASGR